jgi:actin-related protein
MTESIIIDNGTNTIKAGFSDDDMPRVVIPTVLGKPFQTQVEFKKKRRRT